MSPASGSLPDCVETVIFDLDGTLVDASAVWRAAMAETLALAYERYPQLAALGDADEIYRSIIRPAAAERAAEVGGEWDDELIHHAFRRLLAEHASRDDGLAGELQEHYVAARLRGAYRLYDDATRTLEAAGERFRLGLITNGPSEHQRSRIEPLGLDRYFEAIVVSGELGIRKPDPAIFEHLLRRMDVTPDAAVYVGDSLEADVVGAHAAGLAAVWLNRNGTTPEGVTPHAKGTTPEGVTPHAKGATPDAEITTLDELLPLLP